MTTYAIGDIQGCYSPLKCLLSKINFNPEHDVIWVAGDLVNRGPDSLMVLRYLKSLGDSCIAVLGNHDLFLLAVAAGAVHVKYKDTLSHVLEASDKKELLNWLRFRPLLHYDAERELTMVHAGIPPIWSVLEAKRYAEDVQQELRGSSYQNVLNYFFAKNRPESWTNSLSQIEKWQLTVDYFTQMRFCTKEGCLELRNKTAKEEEMYKPWFSFKGCLKKRERIVFGHWAALEGETGVDHALCLDTGCAWGRYLTAMNVDTGEKFWVDSLGRG